MKWYLQALKKYAVCAGRSRRREYWLFELWNVLILLALMTISFMTGHSGGDAGIGLLPALYALAVVLPSFSGLIRRLHDTNRAGSWIAITAIPLIGQIILLVFTLQNGTPGTNRFGLDPKMEVSSPTPEMGTLAPPLSPDGR